MEEDGREMEIRGWTMNTKGYSNQNQLFIQIKTAVLLLQFPFYRSKEREGEVTVKRRLASVFLRGGWQVDHAWLPIAFTGEVVGFLRDDGHLNMPRKQGIYGKFGFSSSGKLHWLGVWRREDVFRKIFSRISSYSGVAKLQLAFSYSSVVMFESPSLGESQSR